ncbi:MAG: hypothetical protein MK289_15530 [Trichodesmium sp. ALOHA_ZT_67]|uniref:hypothetical protein n=1 Tax=Trichodesmium erythraeum TaxID=1206 RepID=UPI0000392D16|nr:hypothetical protein [Trichodesmium sp. ALOHA_ZT_67]MCL2927379.1 hypothetical protein [Trichodesmium sp. MAG_R01]MDT9337956.1 hypothetical protein [Trichodesmium erythraeum 21-75]
MAWDTDDTLSQISINPNFSWRDIDGKRAQKNVSKLQKLIYIASSRGKIPKMRK